MGGIFPLFFFFHCFFFFLLFLYEMKTVAFFLLHFPVLLNGHERRRPVIGWRADWAMMERNTTEGRTWKMDKKICT